MSRHVRIIDVEDVTPWTPYSENSGDAVLAISEEQAIALLDGKALQGENGGVLVLEDVWFDDLDQGDSILDEIADAARRLEEIEDRLAADEMKRTREEITEVRADLVDAAMDRITSWRTFERGGVSES